MQNHAIWNGKHGSVDLPQWWGLSAELILCDPSLPKGVLKGKKREAKGFMIIILARAGRQENTKWVCVAIDSSFSSHHKPINYIYVWEKESQLWKSVSKLWMLSRYENILYVKCQPCEHLKSQLLFLPLSLSLFFSLLDSS